MKKFTRALTAFSAILITVLVSVGLTQERGDAFPGASWFAPEIVWTENFPDPTVMLVGNTYYAISGMHGGNYLPAVQSTDLETWITRSAYSPNPYSSSVYLNDALPEGPSFGPVVSNHPHLDQEIWAPGIGQIGNKFYAYYAVRNQVGTPGQFCLSVAEASHPMGPYTDKRNGVPLECGTDPAGVIDPDPFVDSDGTPYLIYKSEGQSGSTPTRLWARELSTNGTSFAAGSYPTELLETALPWEGNLIENPSMIKYEGKYLLFYSANQYRSANYATGWAVCEGPLGPCERGSTTPLLSSNATELGPGGADAFLDVNGNLQLMYHYWNAPYTSYPNYPSCDTDGDGKCTEFGQRRMKVMPAYLDSNDKVKIGAAPASQLVPEVSNVIATGDFDGDGKDDAAIGAPGEDVGSLTDAGAVSVVYGSNSGLTGVGDQLWSQSGAVAGTPEKDDRFGSSVAAGDFDGDGFDDLAIGAPGEDIGSKKDAGAVHVMYGSAYGLVTAGNKVYSHDNLIGAAESGDLFGYAIGVGDFDNDGYDDLIMGSPGENIGSISDSGAVNVVYGSANGLTTSGNQLFLQDVVYGFDEENDQWGMSLAVGDFNGDSIDDAAVGAPGENVFGINRAGAVGVIFGGQDVGLKQNGNRRGFNQDTDGIAGVAEHGDLFGASLAAGDLNGDEIDDLVVGAPGENGGAIVDSGMIHVLLGAPGGISYDGDQVWSQAGAIAGGEEPFDYFGASVAVGYINGDGRADVIVGAPGEDVGNIPNAGMAHVIFGGSNGLTATGNKGVTSNGAWPGATEWGDGMGAAVATGDINGDGNSDLLLGNPGEDIGSKRNAGAVIVIRATNTGITTAGGQTIIQGYGGIAGAAEGGDAFG